jgi:dTDP-4-dehydrorhamnose 3,5-epimerase-like enzyme
VLIPAGCAHGFLVLDFPAVLVYSQEGPHNTDCDTGVSITSLHISKDVEGLEFSERDRSLPQLADFMSPFTFDPTMYVGWNK